MHRRTLGRLEVSALGLGCMGMSEFYGPTDDAESYATLDLALERGLDFYDTADVYGIGKNELLLAPFVQRHRAKIVLATKFGIVRDGSDPTKRGLDGSPAYVQRACEASLRRLGVETIDLYYLHRKDPKTPIEDTVGAMSRLVEQGKVRHLGLSEVGPETLRRACAVHPITALQTEYSLWSRDPDDGLLEACRALGVGFVAYSPLGRGFLTGQIRAFEDLPEGDYRRLSPRFQGDAFGKNLELVDRIRALAAQKGCTPAQLALAWTLSRGGDVVPIPGTKRRTYLAENLDALTLVLEAADLAAIDEVAPKGAATGLRYPETMMPLVDA